MASNLSSDFIVYEREMKYTVSYYISDVIRKIPLHWHIVLRSGQDNCTCTVLEMTAKATIPKEKTINSANHGRF